MKIRGSKRLVVTHISRRLIAAICVGAGILAVQMYQQLNVETPARFVVHLPHERQPTKPEQTRDLSGYDRGGQVEECSWKEGRERRQCLIIRDMARKFIYDHWKSRTKGYIAIDFPCVDCMPTVHVFIEPDENGKWRISNNLEDGRFGIIPREHAFDVRYTWANEDERRLESSSKVLVFLTITAKKSTHFS